METLLVSYSTTIIAIGVTGGLLLIQLLVADVAGIIKGHIPGTQIKSDHSEFLFRAVRAHANTNESIAAFILLVAFVMLSSGSPSWANGASVAYVIGRVGHMCCYYVNLKLLRSVFFGFSLLALIILLVVGALAWMK